MVGFQKLFTSEDVTLDLDRQIYVILGGNGLGKTTILQSLVYGLAGGLDDEDLESEKGQRWDHKYFRGRLEGRVSSAFVEVTFKLGSATLSVRRGFTRSVVTRFTLGVNGKETNVEVPSADQAFKDAVCRHGDYRTFDDYRFLVHRLIYLAEDRRGITWDMNAQLRALMLFTPHAVNEQQFRKQRAALKRHDSDMRHANVRINHIRSELVSRRVDVPTPTILVEDKKAREAMEQLPGLEDRLEGLLQRRSRLLTRVRSLEGDEAQLRESLSGLADQRRRAEASALARALASTEDSAVLYLHKLLHSGTCPACGQKARELQRLAAQRAARHECMICGEGEGLVKLDENDYQALDSQMAEKLHAKNSIDLEISDLNYQLDEITREESQLRTTYELTRLTASPALSPPSKGLDTRRLNNVPDPVLAAELVSNEAEYARLRSAVTVGMEELQATYSDYVQAAQTATERLVELFEKLACRFLGTKVTLVTITRKGDDPFFDFRLYVPRFGDITRETPDHCSEAQRFFLDIAMRMAMLQLVRELSGHHNSFICETPESALDVSYVDHAAAMFRNFVLDGHSLIATTNLQRLGLAYRLLENSRSEGRTTDVFDMLQHSNLLTDVQKKSGELRDIRDAILEVATR